MRVVVAPDKMRGTASACAVAAAVGRAALTAGWEWDECPLADGGEGTLEAFGGANRRTMVTGPLGVPVEAPWRLDGRLAVIEMAQASGLSLVGGPEGNDPVAASTVGTGELVAKAIDLGARRILVGCGGSATTDGGLGALRTISPLQRLRAVELEVLCDVRTLFVEAADEFAPQKGASMAQVELLRRRLERLADVYLEEHEVEVRKLVGAGAAGGLAGGLAAAGARLRGGFETVADEMELDRLVEGADLVITSEGYVDEQSFEGKVVGGVAELSEQLGVPCAAIVGEVAPELRTPTAPPGPVRLPEMVSLVERFGRRRAENETVACIEEVATSVLTAQAKSDTP